MILQILNVLEIKIHEFFGHLTEIDNDIAMLILERHVDFEHGIQKALIVESDIALRPGTSIEASGWASQNIVGAKPYHMIWSQMRVIDQAKCQAIHRSLITHSNFCASYVVERRLNDNGGPITFKDLLIGIVSYAAHFNDTPNYAIISNVSYFNRWITLNTKYFINKYCINGHETVETFEDY
ncbi:transmembrane protease serine 11C-like isoform X2 [Hyposmocoma kahamanoa]|uniref:transmembrane protease serine 11C-like isoform X2 n=1 Tax=Hyposmocoma kahamanoa TaxID=1477025 RepID=UPI000E6D8CBA|nr:transmembrane protease serine 11C-like isoform X2 [Hyposmocoma kahamanoa]